MADLRLLLKTADLAAAMSVEGLLAAHFAPPGPDHALAPTSRASSSWCAAAGW